MDPPVLPQKRGMSQDEANSQGTTYHNHHETTGHRVNKQLSHEATNMVQCTGYLSPETLF